MLQIQQLCCHFMTKQGYLVLSSSKPLLQLQHALDCLLCCCFISGCPAALLCCWFDDILGERHKEGIYAEVLLEVFRVDAQCCIIGLVLWGLRHGGGGAITNFGLSNVLRIFTYGRRQSE
jgi:hypothetical protein